MGLIKEEDAARASIGESLKVFALPNNKQGFLSGSLAELVRDTHLWHHQILQGDEANHFARTRETQDRASGHQVVQIMASPLSRALKEAIAWVDENITETANAVIIESPAYFLTALWLREIDTVVISSMADGIEGLEIKSRIPSNEFLTKLAASSPVLALRPPHIQLEPRERP
jgi:hypothetical protein